MASQASAAANKAEAQQAVLQRYEERIQYYWSASRYNKRSYKTTRYLTILLGAVVTLISSIASADFVKASHGVAVTFAIATPILAAMLAVVGGVSQAFQWGGAWSDMVLTATRLERERDRILVTPTDEIDPVKEMATLDDLVLNETQTFFQRLFGTGGPTRPAGAGGAA